MWYDERVFFTFLNGNRIWRWFPPLAIWFFQKISPPLSSLEPKRVPHGSRGRLTGHQPATGRLWRPGGHTGWRAPPFFFYMYYVGTTSRYIQLRCCHLVRLQPSVEPVQFLAACTYCCSTILISKPLLCLPRDLAEEEEEKNTKLKPDLLSVTLIYLLKCRPL